MKKIIFAAAVLVLLDGALISCSSKKKSNDIIVPKSAVIPAKEKTQSMSPFHDVRTVSWMGETYTIDVLRKSDPSLPQAQVDENTKYDDNQITVKVVRKNGSVFFSRTFTKSDFSSYIDDDTKKKGALLGIIFVKAESSNLLFAVSVGSPDVTSDEYIPLVMKLSHTGTVDISKDNSLDTGSDTQSDEEE
ncbi:MAG: DUF4738 domain-containing protein [Prevotella sp.]|jgi:hypothetical protein|nr:DUF4738 domain-containing protein [Prevotella sp.]MCI2125730.1 DUF4738 domain-containing protein [Prevotella sp.]